MKGLEDEVPVSREAREIFRRSLTLQDIRMPEDTEIVFESTDKKAGAPDRPRERVLVIQVSSAGYVAGNSAEITIDGKAVEVSKNENNHLRGLHVVVVNAVNGKVETAQAFDTCETGVEFDKFIAEGVPEGRIVVAACKDDCYTHLSNNGKQWFSDMGSV